MISLGLVDRSSPVPLQQQIAHGLRSAIVDGRIGGGEAVPSSRALATDLGVARGTVVAAYEVLLGEGYLLARAGGGTTVAPVTQRDAIPVPGAREADVPLPHLASGGEPGRTTVLDLRPGRPGTRGLPDAAWRAAWRRAAASDVPASVDGSQIAGTAALRAEIAAHLGRTRGVEVEPADVIVTAGTSDALLLTFVGLAVGVDRPLRFGIEDPGYRRVPRILRRLGADVVGIPVRAEEGLDLDALERRTDLDAIVVTPQHHYPLGSRLSGPQRGRLLAWAARSGAVVIEDDYDSEFPHGRAPLPPLRMLDPSRVVLVGSLSKVLTPVLRCGWLVASDEVRDRLIAAREDLDLPVSLVQMDAVARYLATGSLARHTARRRRDYRHRRGLLLEAFADVPEIDLTAMDGGLHAVALLPWATPDEERLMVEELDERGVRVAGLSSYVVSSPASHVPAGLVLGYAAPSTVELVEGVARIVEVVRARARTRGAPLSGRPPS